MSESQFSKRMRDKLEALGIKCYRIESARTSAGIPDIHYVCRNGVTGWIETKLTEQEPVRMPYEPTQALWLDTYAKAGGRCATLLFVEQLNMLGIVWGRNSLQADKRLLGAGFYLDMTRKDCWLKLASMLSDATP